MYKKFLVVFVLMLTAMFVANLSSTDDNLDKLTNTSTKQSQDDLGSNSDTYLVTKVIDGDTIEVKIDGERKKVRYIGIDTPELAREGSEAECFGKEATSNNKDLVLGKYVSLKKDVSDTDKYNRLLRYVYVGDLFVNEELVRNGSADARRYRPDTRLNSSLQKAETVARDKKLGIWSEACAID